MLEDINAEQIKKQFRTNKALRYTAMGVGGLIVLVLGYFAYKQFIWKPSNEKSKDAYWIGLNHAKVDSTDLAIDELKRSINKYDGKVGGEISQFIYARQLMNNGEFKKALDELDDVDLQDTYTRVMAVGLQADCYSELKNYEKAANMYVEAAEMDNNTLTTPMYLMKAGLCAEEIKNFEKAAECYQRIKDDFTDFSSRKQIDKYIARASSKKAVK